MSAAPLPGSTFRSSVSETSSIIVLQLVSIEATLVITQHFDYSGPHADGSKDFKHKLK